MTSVVNVGVCQASLALGIIWAQDALPNSSRFLLGPQHRNLCSSCQCEALVDSVPRTAAVPIRRCLILSLVPQTLGSQGPLYHTVGQHARLAGEPDMHLKAGAGAFTDSKALLKEGKPHQMLSSIDQDVPYGPVSSLWVWEFVWGVCFSCPLCFHVYCFSPRLFSL